MRPRTRSKLQPNKVRETSRDPHAGYRVQENSAPKHTCSARRSPRFHRPSWKSVTAQQFRSPLSSEHSWGLVRPVSRYDFCEALHSIGRGLLYCTARLAFGSLPVVLADGSEVESFGMPPPAGAFRLQRLPAGEGLHGSG